MSKRRATQRDLQENSCRPATHSKINLLVNDVKVKLHFRYY